MKKTKEELKKEVIDVEHGFYNSYGDMPGRIEAVIDLVWQAATEGMIELPAESNMKTERGLFEEWCNTCNRPARSSWEVWQARAALDKPVEQHDSCHGCKYHSNLSCSNQFECSNRENYQPVEKAPSAFNMLRTLRDAVGSDELTWNQVAFLELDARVKALEVRK